MPQKLHKVYGLTDPRTGEVKYIGKSVNPIHRLAVHLHYAAKGGHTHAFRWMKGLLDQGLKPGLVILEEGIPETEVDDRECWWIAEGEERGWRLTNMTDGGDGGHHKYPETGAKISAALKGKPKSPRSTEHSQKLAKALRGRKLSPEAIAKRSETVRRKHAEGYKRPPKSEESKEKQRQKMTGRKQSPEEIEKRIAPLRGSKRTDEQRQNISEGLKARHFVHSPEVIERIAASKRGKPLSPETKARIAEGVRKARAAKKQNQDKE